MNMLWYSYIKYNIKAKTCVQSMLRRFYHG
jgi:hypothetical protein